MQGYLIFFSLLLSTPALAGFSVSSSVDRTQVGINETFVLSIRVEFQDQEPSHVDIPNISSLQDFHLVDQWSSQQRSISIIQGQRSKQAHFGKKLHSTTSSSR